MDYKKQTDDLDIINELNELDLDVADETHTEVDIEANNQKTQENVGRRVKRAASSDKKELSVIKDYPENPFNYFEKNNVNVQLSSGTFQYEVTDFVISGRDGFDLTITRRYDSGCANLKDMKPRIAKTGKFYTYNRENNHNTETYGLGYGWSFVLPSIEMVPYLYCTYTESDEPFQNGSTNWYRRNGYILHLEDGRNLTISREKDEFLDYSLKDINIITMPKLPRNVIRHPKTGLEKNYDIVIEYKNGNKDYFYNTTGTCIFRFNGTTVSH